MYDRCWIVNYMTATVLTTWHALGTTRPSKSFIRPVSLPNALIHGVPRHKPNGEKHFQVEQYFHNSGYQRSLERQTSVIGILSPSLRNITVLRDFFSQPCGDPPVRLLSSNSFRRPFSSIAFRKLQQNLCSVTVQFQIFFRRLCW